MMYQRMETEIKAKPCPVCGEAWLSVSDGDYYFTHEIKKFRISCKCHYVWNKTGWCKTREEAIGAWNRGVK